MKEIGWWRWPRLIRKALCEMARKGKPNRRPSRRLRMKDRQGTVMQAHSLRRCAYLAISARKFRALSAAGGARAAFLRRPAARAPQALGGDFLGCYLGNRRADRRIALSDEAAEGGRAAQLAAEICRTICGWAQGAFVANVVEGHQQKAV